MHAHVREKTQLHKVGKVCRISIENGESAKHPDSRRVRVTSKGCVHLKHYDNMPYV